MTQARAIFSLFKPAETKLQDCSEEMFENGKIVFVIHQADKYQVDRWVREVARRSGEQVDWIFAGDRIHVLGLGDLNKISRQIKEMLPDLNRDINSYMSGKCEKHGYFKPDSYTAEDADYWKYETLNGNCFLKR